MTMYDFSALVTRAPSAPAGLVVPRFTPVHRRPSLATQLVSRAFLIFLASGILSGAPGIPTTGPSSTLARASSLAETVFTPG